VVIARTSSTPQLDAYITAQPDLVDRIFDYLLGEFPQLAGKKFEGVKKDLREEFAGQDVYIPHHPPTERQERVRKVLELFNGRNAAEVARRLNISRAQVYRDLKQAGQNKASQVSGK
jgi:Mor family transcriptional regulator